MDEFPNLERACNSYEFIGRPRGLNPTSAKTLLDSGIANFNRGDYHSATLVCGLSEAIYKDLGMRWEAHVANGWYELAKEKLKPKRL